MGEMVSCMDKFDDLFDMQAVCRAWRDGVRRAGVAVDCVAWDLDGFRASFPRAAAVTLSYHATDDTISALRGMVSLRHLHGSGSGWVTDSGMAGLLAGAGALTSLTSLDLVGHDSLSGATAERLAALPCLTELSLHVRCLVNGGRDSVARMGGLRKLHVQGEGRFCVRELAGDEARGACEVPEGSKEGKCICRMGPSAAGIAAMAAGLTSLTELSLEGWHLVSGAALSAIAAMPALTSLRMTYPYRSEAGEYDDDPDPPSAECLRGATGLTKLDLGFCDTWVRDDGMAALLDGDGAPTALTSLNLQGCDRLAEATAERVAALPRLTELILPSLCMGHGGCESIARMGGTLRSLRVQIVNGWDPPCRRLAADDASCEVPEGSHGDKCVCKVGPSAAGIAAMAAGLTSLTELSLAGFELVSGAALSAIAAMPALTALALADCGDRAGRPLSMECLRCATGLTKLDLSDCQTLATNDGLAALRGMTGLAELSLHNCEEVGDPGMASLAGYLPRLRLLTLTNTRITGATLDALAERTNLKRLAVTEPIGDARRTLPWTRSLERLQAAVGPALWVERQEVSPMRLC